MSPYDVLGIDPDADVEEAEEAYHRLLRRYHPDLHQSGGPEALAAAEARTQALNAAMTQIRSGTAGGWTAAPSGPARPSGDGRRADQDLREDREDVGPRTGTDFADPPPVATCPFCGQPFAASRPMKRHVLVDHDIRLTREARPSRFNGRMARQIRLMRFVSVWYVLPINVLVAMMIGLAFAPLDVQLGLWWFGIAMSPTIVILLTRGFDKG